MILTLDVDYRGSFLEPFSWRTTILVCLLGLDLCLVARRFRNIVRNDIFWYQVEIIVVDLLSVEILDICLIGAYIGKI